MSGSIAEQLQQNINPEVAFADVKQNFSDPDKLVGELKQTSLPQLDTEQFAIPSFDLSSLDNEVGIPISENELEVEISTKLNRLNSINLENLSAAIPESPSADNFQDIEVASEIQTNISNLTKDLIGDLSIGGISKQEQTPQGSEEIFGEFDRFITNAGMLPVRTLDALLKAFKKLLDKLSDPEQLLQQLGQEGITNVFQEQILALKVQIPSEAIKIIASNIDRRKKKIGEYNEQVTKFKELIEQFNSHAGRTDRESKVERIKELKEEIVKIRKSVKNIAKELEELDFDTAIALEKLKEFDLNKFKTKLENLAKNNDNEPILESLFEKINSYINNLKQKIEAITKNLREFTQKIPQLIDEGINKVEVIVIKITETINQKITQGTDVLNQLKEYLSGIIQKIKDFIEQTAARSSELVKPFKDVSNQASKTIVSKIDDVSAKITEATGKLETSIRDVNGQIEGNLNKEQLIKKIGELLDRVTAVLDGEAVRNALSTTESGINTITNNLNNVTLKPAFDTVVTKSHNLEEQLKAVNVSQLSTPSRAALKVGTEVIKQVDIPGTVTPELESAFEEILNPLENIIVLIEGEFQKIDRKIVSFTPGTLVEEFLSPYLAPVINTLNEYKPSTLLEPVKEFYHELLDKMEAINPNQLLEKLEQLYQKIVKVIESLSPERISNFLKEQIENLQQQLDNLPVEALADKVKNSLGQVDKLMASLGLGDVLKSDFWQTLTDILSFSFADKIKEIEIIRDRVSDRVGKIDDKRLTRELNELKKAIADYTSSPDASTNISIITTANSQYQEEVENLLNIDNTLEGITPPPEVIVDYRDLKKRLEKLYNIFSDHRSKSPQNIDELGNIVKDTKRLKGTKALRDKLEKTANAVLNDKLITDFKKAIPNEIDRQITNPLKESLENLDKILVKPRAILGDIEKVIEKIAEAPGKLAQILAIATDKLVEDIKSAIKSLKDAIGELTDEVVAALEDTHKTIVQTVKQLNPRRLLHIFDVSDFARLDLFITRIRQPQEDDFVSKYIGSKLSPNTKSLLSNSSSEPAKAVIQDLNRLLLDKKLYTNKSFTLIKLSSQAIALEAKTKQLREQDNSGLSYQQEGEIIFFNRLLLEAAYNQPSEERIISLNIESIFPYLKVKIAEIYPQEVINELDKLHQNIIELLENIPEAIGEALEKQYQEKIVNKTEALREAVNALFQELRIRLQQLKSELNIGLEDVGDSFDRLINAIPV